MNNIRMYHFLIFLLTLILISGCSNIRDSAGVNRKSPDEFQVLSNKPLSMPPNYDLVPPSDEGGRCVL